MFAPKDPAYQLLLPKSRKPRSMAARKGSGVPHNDLMVFLVEHTWPTKLGDIDIDNRTGVLHQSSCEE